MKRNILVVALALAAVSCQKEAVDANIESDAKVVTIDVAMDNETDSRVSTSDDWNTAWEQNDNLVSGQYSAAAAAIEKFTMESCCGKSASFSGTVNTDAAWDYNIRFLYGGTAAKSGYSVNFTVDVAAQNGKLNKTMLISENSITGAELSKDPSPAFAMKHIGAVMTVKVDIQNFKAGYKLAKLKYCDVPTAMTFGAGDIYTEIKPTSKTTGDIIATLAEPIDITTEGVSVNLNIIPFVVKEADTRDIVLTFTDADGKVWQSTVTKEYTSSYSLERATYNTNTFVCDMNDMEEAIVGDEFTDLSFFNKFVDDQTYTEDMLPSSDTWIINVTDMSADAYIANAVEYAESLGREIDLYFPKLATVSTMSHLGAVAEHLSFPVATAVAQGAFQSSSAVKTLYLPKVEKIGAAFIAGCYQLESLELATAKGTTISDLGSDQAFTTVELNKVTLTIGESSLGVDEKLDINDNGQLVINGTAYYGPYTFNDIVIVDNK